MAWRRIGGEEEGENILPTDLGGKCGVK